MPQPLRIVFAGTPEFAVPSLQALLDAGHDVVGVYTQPDRPSGRGRRLRASPVKEAALAAGLAVEQPPSLRDAEAQARLAGYRPQLMVVAAYGLILPREVLDLPPLGCVNVHASLLPRWRGAAPIQRAILAGDTETGISIMQMAEGLDTGDVLLRETIPIGPEDTAAVLHDRLASLGARTLVQALAGVAEGRLTPEPQDDRAATYATKLSKQEAVLDWSSSAEQLARAVRAFNPWPVASAASPLGNLRIWRARAVATATEAAPGTVLAEGPEGIDVATGDGCLRIEVLQRPGGRPLESAAFLSGVSLAGERLGEGG